MTKWVLAALLLGACSEKPARCVVSGASTLSANLDDDDGDGRIDGLQTPPPRDDDDVLSVSACPGPVSLRGVPEGEVRLWQRGDAGWSPLRNGRLEATTLGVEVVRGRSPSWRAPGEVVLGDAGVIVITSAPVLLRHVDQPVREVWVTEVTDDAFGATTTFSSSLARAVAPLPVRRLPGDLARADRWVQDAFQGASMGGRSLVVRLPRAGALRGLSNLSHGRGLPSNVGLLSTGVLEDSRFDYGGDLDVLPPHGAFPEGRLLAGKDISPALLAWLEAQGAQTPAVLVPTAWLGSGHVDDVVLPLPSRGAVLRVAMPSTSLGLAVAPVHAEFNRACQRHLDEAEEVLRAAVAPTPLEVLRLPVVFAPRTTDAGVFAEPVVPNPVNAVVVGNRLLLGAPDAGAPGQALQRAVSATLEDAGFAPVWLDVSAYAPRGGSVHCAVELIGP